jgi:hypothetical protein
VSGYLVVLSLDNGRAVPIAYPNRADAQAAARIVSRARARGETGAVRVPGPSGDVVVTPLSGLRGVEVTEA